MGVRDEILRVGPRVESARVGADVLQDGVVDGVRRALLDGGHVWLDQIVDAARRGRAFAGEPVLLICAVRFLLNLLAGGQSAIGTGGEVVEHDGGKLGVPSGRLLETLLPQPPSNIVIEHQYIPLIECGRESM